MAGNVTNYVRTWIRNRVIKKPTLQTESYKMNPDRRISARLEVNGLKIVGSTTPHHQPDEIIKKWNSEILTLTLVYPYFSSMKINSIVSTDCGLVTFKTSGRFSDNLMEIEFNHKGLNELGIDVDLKLFRRFFQEYFNKRQKYKDRYILDYRYLSVEFSKHTSLFKTPPKIEE